MTEIIIETVEYSEQKKAIKTIRKQVFQIEQGVTEKLEFDGLDEAAIHLLAYWKNQPVGTARIRTITEKTAKIERLSVLPVARRQGIGKALMIKAIEIITIQNYHTAIIHAQEYVKSLYQQLGFEQLGNSFEEANIPHIKMSKKLNKAK